MYVMACAWIFDWLAIERLSMEISDNVYGIAGILYLNNNQCNNNSDLPVLATIKMNLSMQ